MFQIEKKSEYLTKFLGPAVLSLNMLSISQKPDYIISAYKTLTILKFHVNPFDN